jgi:trk system potassium uptake protein TrkH
MMFLMFVGGSPGSTAGGIKTVNIALMIGTAWSRFRGFDRVHFFRRSIPGEIVARGLTIILVSFSVVTVALSLLLISETGHLDHQMTRDAFLKLLFETISAFGTVGLSMDVTPGLTSWGKLIIIVTMFLGRLGPMTVAMAMMRRNEAQKTYHFGEEDIIVG